MAIPIKYATVDYETGKPILTKEEASRLKSMKPTEKRGLLLVTTFGGGDVPILRKRIEWLSHLKIKCPYDLLMVADHDVLEVEFLDLVEQHKPFFEQVYSRNIKEAPRFGGWPDSQNAAFRKTYRILTGQYGEKFSWSAYSGWFNFESDVVPLKNSSFEELDSIYKASQKPFCGFVSQTKTSSGMVVRHLNGACVYPTRNDNPNYYNADMMLRVGAPWDVVGLDKKILNMAHPLPASIYIHFFGTWEYKKEGSEIKAEQRLMDKTTKEVRMVIENQIFHHGCKDGSLIDILMGGKSNEPSSPGPSCPILEDHKNGMKWGQLLSKYKVSPKVLKQILG